MTAALAASPAARGRPADPAAGDRQLARLEHRSQAMGGRLDLHVLAAEADAAAAEREMRQVAGRVRAWASILTRHDTTSELMRLNDSPRHVVDAGPTLGAALRWAREAGRITAGTVDVTLLDARLQAEQGVPEPTAPGAGAWGRPGARQTAGRAGRNTASAWDLVQSGRRESAAVVRAPGVRFDLDGVAKGWIADRALGRLRWPGALVDADGDIAVRSAPDDRWEIGVGDPRDDAVVLAVLVLPGGLHGPRTYGVATSGTSIHRWGGGSDARHHLIDPLTAVPANTDVVQATVIASTAREAEAWAKTIVIRGAAAGLDLVERSDALGAVALLYDGRTVALPRTSRYLA